MSVRGAYGCRALSTPHIDRLASTGQRYDRAVSPTPICVPARASLMTGQGSAETGVTANNAWLRPDRGDMGMRTWPEYLSDAGYRTAGIGKMHFYPWDITEGFGVRVIAEDKRHIHIQDDYADFLAEKGYLRLHGKDQPGYIENQGAIVHGLPDELHVDRWVTDRALEYLENTADDRPFAAMIGFPGPHCPYDPPKEYLEMVDESNYTELIDDESVSWMVEEMAASNRHPWNGVDYSDFPEENRRRIRRHYLASVKHLDDQIGRILDYLESSGLSENTVVLLTSDHGDFIGDRQMVGKQFFFRQAVDIPMILVGPGVDPGSDGHLRSLTDVFATILNLAGYDTPPMSDSRSLLTVGDEDRVVCGMLDVGLFVARGDWRLSRYRNGEVRLYNITEDPQEVDNRAADPAASSIRADLESGLMDWLANSLYAAHRDKYVRTANADPGSSFNRPNWVRPYPGNPNSNKL